jgi:hypothetical protein
MRTLIGAAVIGLLLAVVAVPVADVIWPAPPVSCTNHP